MSAIVVKYDNKLEQDPVEVQLLSPTAEENDGEDNLTEISQTAIQGVMTPIVSICGIVFDFNQVITMTLSDEGSMPSLDLVVRDDQNYLSTISKPDSDNSIRLIIVPPFEDAYKKINLTFYISNITVNERFVHLTAMYKVPDLYSSRLKSFGEISTYQLFDTIASECRLGFASNCEDNSNDKRYIYACNTSYEKILAREIKGSGDATNIYDYWIDLWNNLNFVNMYERFNAKDPDEDMEIWVLGEEPSQSETVHHREAMLKEALLTNHPDEIGQLHVFNYKINSNSQSNVRKGTDVVYTVYKNGDVIDNVVMDGDVKHDIFTRYEYLGENIGDYEYLTAGSLRKSFMNKINSSTIEVSLGFPLLALTRGQHVKLAIYENNQINKYDIDVLGGEIENNDMPIDQDDDIQNQDALIINKQVSGEYLILQTRLSYNEGRWNNTLILTKPIEQNTYIEQ